MLLGLDFNGLTRLELGKTDGGFAGDPLVFLLAEEGLPERLANDFARVVVKTGGDLRLDRVFQFGRQGDVHGGGYED